MKPRTHRNARHWLYTTFVIIAGLGFLLLLDNAYRNELRLEDERWLKRAATEAQSELTKALQQKIAAVQSLTAFMLAGEQLPDSEAFTRFAQDVQKRHSGIIALVYVDEKRIIRTLVPLEPNKKALGLDLSKRSSAPFVERAIDEQRIVVDNPHPIVGGQLAIVARAPLYRNNTLLGLAQGVFEIPVIVEEALSKWQGRVEFSLRDQNNNLFLGTSNLPEGAHSRIVTVGDNYWTLTIAKTSHPAVIDFGFTIIWGIGAILILLLAHDVYRTLSHSRLLNRAVETKTRELAESEKKYRTLMEHAGDGVIICDVDGLILDVNRRMLELLGYTREEITTLRIRDIHPDEEWPVVEAFCKSASEKNAALCEYRVKCKNGTTAPVEVVCGTIPLDGGTVKLGLFRDIRERKRIEEELDCYRRDLEQLVTSRTRDLLAANKELEAFSYSVSHDLRAPLRAINGFSQILEEECGEYFDETSGYYLQRIRNATLRMECLIDGLLKLSKTATAKLTIESVDISAIATDVIDELRAIDPERSVQVQIEPNLIAHADANLTRSLLQNLLGNAWKFTRLRDQAVIEFGSIEEKSGTPVFWLRDNGTGFETKHAAYLFVPFNRLHDDPLFDGTGIGLATAQRIVDRHGGEIWAEGEPGKQAIFYFTLERSPILGREPSADKKNTRPFADENYQQDHGLLS